MTPDRIDRALGESATPIGDFDEFERFLAEIELASLGDHRDVIPSSLTHKLTDDARLFFAVTPSTTRPNRLTAWSGWAVAAGLLVAFSILALSPKPTVASKSFAQLRDEMKKMGVTQFSSAPESKSTGEIVWDGTSQKGYLTVKGLSPNISPKRQYQLWIVDTGRPHAEPVDGGVFDVDESGTAIVPIRAALSIRTPTLFAVTEEQAGGVVVSENGKRGEFVVVMAKR